MLINQANLDALIHDLRCCLNNLESAKGWVEIEDAAESVKEILRNDLARLEQASKLSKQKENKK